MKDEPNKDNLAIFCGCNSNTRPGHHRPAAVWTPMMTQFSVIKNGLVPHDDEARALLGKLKIGAVVDVDVLNPINTKFNGKIMAAITKLAQGMGVTVDAMRATLLIETGRYRNVQLVTMPKRVTVPDSMSRNAMTMADREQFWTDMQEVAREKILPKLKPQDADEVLAMFDERKPNADDVSTMPG